MSELTLFDIDFKNKMALVWTTLKFRKKSNEPYQQPSKLEGKRLLEM